MRIFGSFEAKNRLSELLSLAEAGEEIGITRCGKIVARLVPPRPAHDVAAALATVERIKAMREGVLLGGLSVKELISEGRR